MSKFDRVANLIALIDEAMPDLMELKHRELLLAAQHQITQLRDELELRKNECEHLATDRNNLALGIEKLRKERDEARQRFCTMSVQLGQFYRRVGGKTVQVTTPEDVADIMGWDCFNGES
jgi:predicted  nucleic acid-binding Zn-ribbon protein